MNSTISHYATLSDEGLLFCPRRGKIAPLTPQRNWLRTSILSHYYSHKPRAASLKACAADIEGEWCFRTDVV